MPRVALMKKEYMKQDLRVWISGQMAVRGISQEKAGELIGLSQSAFYHRLKLGLFTYEQLLILFNAMEATDEEILRMMKY